MSVFVPKNFVFDPFEDNTDFLCKLSKLSKVNPSIEKEVKDAIQIINRLTFTLNDLLFNYDWILDSEAQDELLRMYVKSIDMIRTHEGKEFGICLVAIKTCLWIALFVFGLVSDSCFIIFDYSKDFR